MTEPTYCTIEDVINRIETISGSNVTMAMISGAIIHAEGLIDGAMRKTGRGSSSDYTFDKAKHGLVNQTASAIAAYDMLAFIVEDFQSNSSAALSADLLWSEINRNMGILLDDRVIKWYEGI